MKALIKISSVFIALFFIVVLSFNSCKKDENGILNEKEECTPKSIVGKSIVLYSTQNKKTLEASNFDSDGKCNVPMPITSFKLVTTPMYTYSSMDNKESANFTLDYTHKLQYGKDYTCSKMTYTVELTFKNPKEGTYNGTEKTVTTGNVPKLNGTSSRSLYGTFILH
jgi:hypothetical protein